MTRIFISYRRQDSPSTTGRIYDKLESVFGSDRVFRDLNDIAAGQDFRAKIAQEVNQSDVLLVIIGPRWESITDNQGNRRLENPDDFVRIEVEEGLKNPQKIVIPILVENASMPRPESLPKSLRELCYRNAVSVRQDPDFHPDMQKLVQQIKQIRQISRKGVPVYRQKPVMLGAGILAGLVCLAAILIAGFLALQANRTPPAIYTIAPTSPTIDSSPTATTEPTPTNTLPVEITVTVTETIPPAVSGPVRIGVIQIPDSVFKDTVKRLDNLGFEAEWIDSASGYKEFAKFDVVYLPIGWSAQNARIENQASDYQLFLNEGGGLVVEQPDVRSAFTSKLFPYGMVFNVMPDDPNDAPPVVAAGHDIVQNIRPSELPGPGDKMGPKDGRWQVLTLSAKTNYATLAVAEYGRGRIAVMASGISKHKEVEYPVGDHFIERLIAWVSSSEAP